MFKKDRLSSYPPLLEPGSLRSVRNLEFYSALVDDNLTSCFQNEIEASNRLCSLCNQTASKWRFPKMGGTSKSSFLDGIFHYKASILGYLHFRKPPNHCFQIENRLTAAFPHEALRPPVGGDLKQHGFCGRLMKKPYTIYGISLNSQASLTVKRGGDGAFSKVSGYQFP